MRRLKDSLKNLLPGAAARSLQIRSVQIKEQTRRLSGRGRHLQEIFSRYYADNAWNDPESVSGPGSSLAETQAVRAALPELLRELGVRSLLDAPCGDGNWIEPARLGLDLYTGLDIVPELIEHNRRRLAGPGVELAVADLTRDPLPRADLILCRDCLIHLSFHYIRRALANFARSGAEYLLTTTYSGLSANQDILSGQWRPIDLQLAPFNLPEPLRLLCEKEYEEGGVRLRRNLGLWRMAELGTV